MKQTSIEWLQEQIFNSDWSNMSGEKKLNLFEVAKEMHKQEIIDAHIEGQRVFDKHDHTQWTTDQAEQYYQETFKKD
jgi:hypothetical protein